jgi:hypothetical protein
MLYIIEAATPIAAIILLILSGFCTYSHPLPSSVLSILNLDISNSESTNQSFNNIE